MSKLIFEFDETGKSKISAFAFNVAHLIEELIDETTENLTIRNKYNEALILGFHQKLQEPLKSEYAEYFGIKTQTSGKL